MRPPMTSIREAPERLAQAIAAQAINLVLEALDFDEVLARIDLNAVLARVDMNALLEQLDLNALLPRLELEPLIARSTTSALGVTLDAVVARHVNQLIRRRAGDLPAGPAPLVSGAVPTSEKTAR
jgi:hypothetical protein